MPVIINGTTGVTFPNGVTMSDGTSAPVTIAQGGTGANTASAARTSLGVAIGTDVLAPNGSGANLTSLNATNISAGTLAVARGGTGTASLTANNVLLGNGTSAVQVVAPGTNGNVLTSNGTTWTSAALPAGGVTSLNGQTGAITDNTYNAISSYAQVYGAEGAQATVGSTAAGSSLRKLNTSGSFTNAGLTGTWRFMGADEINGSGIYVRIS